MTEDLNDSGLPSRDERARQLRDERRDMYASRINVVTLFDRLGYDLGNPDDINRLSENLRYAEKQRRYHERLENSKAGWLVSLVLVVAGAALTTLIQWFQSAKTH